MQTLLKTIDLNYTNGKKDTKQTTAKKKKPLSLNKTGQNNRCEYWFLAFSRYKALKFLAKLVTSTNCTQWQVMTICKIIHNFCIFDFF